MSPGRALCVARELAEGLLEEGPDSDGDLLVAGPRGFSSRLERHGGWLVSVTSRTPESYRRELADPGSVCAAVPGWREAILIHDPKGVVVPLIEDAKAWTWEPLAEPCDRWVAEEIASLAEEVHKLVSALRCGNRTTAVQRSLLAVRLAPILAVHHRILYGSQNDLWNLVYEAMGQEWQPAQSSALGINSEPFEQTCRAALELYGLVVDEVGHPFDGRQKRVAGHALELAGLADG